MKAIWPILDQNLIERKKRINDGLIATQKGHEILKEAKLASELRIKKSKIIAENIVSDATKEGSVIINGVKLLASKERNDTILSTNKQINQSILQAKIELRSEISILVIHGVKEILNREVNYDDHKKILNNLSKRF